MTREGSGARLVRNTLANGAGAASGVLIGLILTPFVIDGVGISAYGVFALALSLSFLGGYAAITDLGVEAATARFVAEARARDDTAGVNVAASSALVFFGAIALVVGPVIVLLSGPLVSLFGVEGDLRDAARLCFAFVGVQMFFELPARVYFAVLEGAQRFTVFQVLELTRGLAQAAGFVTVLVVDGSVAGLSAVTAAASLLMLLLGRVLAHRAVPGLRVSLRLASRAGLRPLLGYGTGLFATRLTGTLYRQMDKAIIGIGLDVRAVAVYEIANRIHTGAAMVQSVAASALLPAAAYARERVEVLREMFLRGTCYALAASLPVTLGAIVLAEPLVRTWVGERLTDAAGPTRLFLVYLVVLAVIIVGMTMVVALGEIRYVLLASIANLVLNFALSVALVGPLGVEGVILATLIAQTLMAVPVALMLMRRFAVPLSEWMARVVRPNLPGLVAQGATAWPIAWLGARADDLILVGLLLLASMATSYAAFFRFGLDGTRRAQLTGTVREALGT